MWYVRGLPWSAWRRQIPRSVFSVRHVFIDSGRWHRSNSQNVLRGFGLRSITCMNSHVKNPVTMTHTWGLWWTIRSIIQVMWCISYLEEIDRCCQSYYSNLLCSYSEIGAKYPNLEESKTCHSTLIYFFIHQHWFTYCAIVLTDTSMNGHGSPGDSSAIHNPNVQHCRGWPLQLHIPSQSHLNIYNPISILSDDTNPS